MLQVLCNAYQGNSLKLLALGDQSPSQHDCIYWTLYICVPKNFEQLLHFSCNKWTNPEDFMEKFGYASLISAIESFMGQLHCLVKA